MTGALPQPGWYTDSSNSVLLRWWDGSAWTEHTRDSPGQQPAEQQPAASRQGPPSRVGSGPLYATAELLVVEQAPAGNALSFQLLDAAARVLGTVHQVDATGRAGVALPAVAEQDMRYYRLFDAAGTPLLQMVQPYGAGNVFKPKFSVTDARGAPIGEIKAETAGMGKNRLSYHVGGTPAGGFKATSWLSSKYRVHDAWDKQVAEIVKREFGENPLPHIPSEHESYLLSRPQPLPEPLGSLVLLSPVALDIAYHDDAS
jgi:hypothetical protein